MKLTNHIKPILLVLLFLLSASSSTAFAGPETEEEIQKEIGFLAKKLLEISGKDTYRCDVESLSRPLIGICSDVSNRGVVLTCITPGSQADKAGLRTGDLIVKLNGIEMANDDVMKTKKAY